MDSGALSLLAFTVGFGLLALSPMIAVLVLVVRKGGWSNAMKRTARGRWPLARWLLLLGALLGIGFGRFVLWLIELDKSLGQWPP